MGKGVHGQVQHAHDSGWAARWCASEAAKVVGEAVKEPYVWRTAAESAELGGKVPVAHVGSGTITGKVLVIARGAAIEVLRGGRGSFSVCGCMAIMSGVVWGVGYVGPDGRAVVTLQVVDVRENMSMSRRCSKGSGEVCIRPFV